MLRYPAHSWFLRIAALLLAVTVSLYVVGLYIFGEKFVGAVTALARLPVAAAPAPAQTAAKTANGVVPIMVIPAEKK